MDDSTRARLFWLACIPLRLSIGATVLYLGYRLPHIFPFVAIYTAATVFGFAHNLLRTIDGTKTTGGLGGRVWWVRMRIVHMLAWLTCTVLILLQVEWAGAVLVLDALAGVAAGIAHFRFGRTL